MNGIYVESSAVLRWLLQSDARIESELAQANAVVTSALTLAEVGRTLRRLAATGAIPERSAKRLWARFKAVAAHWSSYEVSGEILARCADAFDSEPVRTLDAIHLATISEHVAAVGEIAVLSVDDRVCDNARAFGLAVVP